MWDRLCRPILPLVVPMTNLRSWMDSKILRACLCTILVAPASWFCAGSAWSGFEEGYAAAQQRDYARAVLEWMPIASQGHVLAQYNLGLLYFRGYGVPQSNSEAVKWWRKAAEQNHVKAQQWLGWAYANGRGVAEDFQEAGKWFRAAAEQVRPSPEDVRESVLLPSGWTRYVAHRSPGEST